MKKIIQILLLVVTVCLVAACNQEGSRVEKGTIDQGDIRLFPKPKSGFVGDPMPYYEDGVMYVFYLYDGNYGTIGFHPWNLMTTSDFLHWTDLGEVIPYVDNISSQDLALGTGSVIKGKDGLYHAFYTGHNGSGEMPYFEKIQHATSTDLVHWTKHPEYGFYGGHNDFRDPYVLYMEEEGLYWMLVTTRDHDHGVLRLYKSPDLYHWTDHGVFFRNDEGTYNLECPTLIKYGEYWYLSYSAQVEGNGRIVHYRYTDDLSKGFIRPERDYFDGRGLYAGRIEKMGDRLFLFGWVGTKELETDAGEYLWGGNLVVHELMQHHNGHLSPILVSEIDEVLSHQVRYQLINGNVERKKGSFTFHGHKGYEYVLFEELLEKPTKITFKLNLSESKNFGITFNAFESVQGDLNVFFNVEESKLEFYKVPVNQIRTSEPEISIHYQPHGNQELECILITEENVFVLYVNGELALTSRAYNLAKSPFGFFTLNSQAVVKDVKFFE